MLSNYINHSRVRILAISLLCLIALASCECSSSHQVQESPKKATSTHTSVEAQRDFLEKERESIHAYIKDRDLEMERTGTGLYYEILEDADSETFVEADDLVDFEYDIYLMNGTLIYSWTEDGIKTLKVDKEDGELGMHESLKLLGLGDKGRFILPSHLAFGVGGDQYKVPPKTPLVYELKVIKIIKSKS